MRLRSSPGSRLVYRYYERRLRRDLQGGPVPRHIAMIIDGNRRWAREQKLASVGHGHRAGAAKLYEFVDWCDRIGVEVVTLYLLSRDNLSGRASEELGELCEIIAELADGLSHTPGRRIRHVGDTLGLPEPLCAALTAAVQRTHDRPGIVVNLAVGYGGRHELVEAVRRILRAAEGESPAEIAERLSPELIAEHLSTAGQPDPDLVIRTSGEQRLSDFMLWQSAHSEFYFVEALGPDLREVDFLRAIRAYGQRERRYGR
ncbi:polyprenyl diphosphate synthase [Agrococcus sp. HG114]|uniref:polyprenyl diphosphate synthase n=1 Tax=Agrococcus sp. HG114 TaxID=2969757 RepID=UPI00215B0B1D|nr:polyprenyl diphosphate synthase [Agrococcus sp. HG114]MCR8671234.1 polyprenyl diphosphate synthase [Agrococcus sp. HG114]